jgi:hypothetical protein
VEGKATGGVGGNGGTGDAGGIGRGGAYVHTVTFGTSTPLSNLSHVTMLDDQATGGAGGVGGIGGNGGNGGNGQGGAIRALLGTINVSHSLLFDNQATGGAGGRTVSLLEIIGIRRYGSASFRQRPCRRCRVSSGNCRSAGAAIDTTRMSLACDFLCTK